MASRSKFSSSSKTIMKSYKFNLQVLCMMDFIKRKVIKSPIQGDFTPSLVIISSNEVIRLQKVEAFYNKQNSEAT